MPRRSTAFSPPYCPEASVLAQHARTAVVARMIIVRRNVCCVLFSPCAACPRQALDASIAGAGCSHPSQARSAAVDRGPGLSCRSRARVAAVHRGPGQRPTMAGAGFVDRGRGVQPSIAGTWSGIHRRRGVHDSVQPSIAGPACTAVDRWPGLQQSIAGPSCSIAVADCSCPEQCCARACSHACVLQQHAATRVC